ncbi:ABC transporter ATP-binding protein [Metabacillus malikii]|uniref:ABC-2 type transport system ATP-binding protein n=1 Tax=Metabacillus malikii TaxID=1504265 RepID=A0ABT9ZPA0_9BACI|nr:ABC transporter ATP-binding protein [Metabacillus malikii]MDQ0233601.1 ABC-2 type transport system ATP-binding protein [Metabacillus malikii]
MINAGQAVLHVTHLSKSIRKTEIIKDVSFQLKRGEILGLLGPNGSGKTTILKMLVGLIKPTSGQIEIENTSLLKNPQQAIRHVGSIIENPVMYDFLSGYDNLVHFFRMTDKFNVERIDEVIEQLHMEEYIHDKVYTYSLGMKQRVGLAQAILHQPSILLLDEPTNGLDPEGIKSLRETLRDLAETQHVSIIISSHILAEIELICDSVMVIDKGKCIVKGTMADLQGETDGNYTFTFKVLESSKVERVLKHSYSDKEIRYDASGFTIEATLHEVAQINKFLISSGINVVGIERNSSPLEEIFLTRLGGEQD